MNFSHTKNSSMGTINISYNSIINVDINIVMLMKSRSLTRCLIV